MNKTVQIIIIWLLLLQTVSAESLIDLEKHMLRLLQQADKAMKKTEYGIALQLNSKAATLTQTLDVADHLWQQYQQRAIILQALGQSKNALDYWQLAIEQLNRIQPWREGEQWQADMQSAVKQYVELLLQGDNNSEQYAVAIQAWESLKRSQIAEYLGSACIIPNQEISSLLQQQKNIAILYPIVLDDRIELLVKMTDMTYRYSIKQNPSRISQLIKRINHAITHLRPEYNRYGKALYNILLNPVIPVLQTANIDTLVWIQDTTLHSLPLAALQNSDNNFVIQDYALVMSPSLGLLSNTVRQKTSHKILLAGLEKAQTYQQQFFPALPGVQAEMHWLQQYYSAVVLNDVEFSRENLIAQLQHTDYDIVHLATHAQIGATINSSFLLTNNGSMPFSELEHIITARQFSTYPLELLTLSACQTAISVKDASLGLGGLLVQTGARTVLASLWQVDDRASAILMQNFYSHWGLYDKAHALQQAQQQLLVSDYKHPFYWSGFTLTGHWD